MIPFSMRAAVSPGMSTLMTDEFFPPRAALGSRPPRVAEAILSQPSLGRGAPTTKQRPTERLSKTRTRHPRRASKIRRIDANIRNRGLVAPQCAWLLASPTVGGNHRVSVEDHLSLFVSAKGRSSGHGAGGVVEASRGKASTPRRSALLDLTPCGSPGLRGGHLRKPPSTRQVLRAGCAGNWFEHAWSDGFAGSSTEAVGQNCSRYAARERPLAIVSATSFPWGSWTPLPGWWKPGPVVRWSLAHLQPTRSGPAEVDQLRRIRGGRRATWSPTTPSSPNAVVGAGSHIHPSFAPPRRHTAAPGEPSRAGHQRLRGTGPV